VSLSDLVNIIGQQNTLSGIQKWAQAAGQSGQLDPNTAQLFQDSPRVAEQMMPALIQRQMQMQMLGINPQQGSASNPQLSSQGGSAIQQYAGSVGDQNPNAPIPQGLPSQMPQGGAQQPQGGNALDQVRQAFALGNGNIEAGMKALQAQKALQIPPGTGPIPPGQQYQNGKLVNLPGAMTPGQQDRDKDFADIYTPFKNSGGQQTASSNLNAIQGVIDKLNNGSLTTGGPLDRFTFDGEGNPTDMGRAFNPELLAANQQVMKAVLPSSKALFGARVTQKEVAMNLMANGLSPYAPVAQNIQNLITLKNNLATAQQATAQAGQYFDKNGTLAGYQAPVPGIDPVATPSNPQGATNQPTPQLLDALKKRGLLKNGG